MVVLQPISTSSPISTPPNCGTLNQPFSVLALPNPSPPRTAPGWTIHLAPRLTFLSKVTLFISLESLPIQQESPILQPGPI